MKHESWVCRLFKVDAPADAPADAGVLSLLLASLAYHHSFLGENLPENSRLRSTLPF